VETSPAQLIFFKKTFFLNSIRKRRPPVKMPLGTKFKKT
jgi:hypothetical protein